jgi:hypothetical protein
MNFDPNDVDSIDFGRLVSETIPHFKDYIEERESNYHCRARFRKMSGRPTLAVVGHGECGKDSVALILKHRCGLDYDGGTSAIFAPMIAHCLEQDVYDAYEERRMHREFWFRWMSAYRERDAAGVARLQLANSDFCVGIRGRLELLQSVLSGVVTLPVWVERPGKTTGAHEVNSSLVVIAGGIILNNDKEGLYHLEEDVTALALSLGLSVNETPIYER